MSVPAAPLSAVSIVPPLWSVAERSALATHLRQILSIYLPNNKIDFATPAALDYWTAAFTHKSLTSLASANYEFLEKVGDAYSKAIFMSYLDKKLPIAERSPAYYTDLVRLWLSKDELAKFSQELGLTRFIKYDPAVVVSDQRLEQGSQVKLMSLYEDAFEAFIGALVTVVDRTYRDGAGFPVAKTWFEGFLGTKNILISPEEARPPETTLKEIYDAQEWGQVKYETSRAERGGVWIVKVLGPDGDRLAIGSHIDDRQAKKAAARAALAELARQGITWGVATEKHWPREVEQLSIQVNNALRKYGSYSPVTFGTLRVKPYRLELQTIQDFGTPQRIQVALAQGEGAGWKEAAIMALQNFLNSLRIH